MPMAHKLFPESTQELGEEAIFGENRNAQIGGTGFNTEDGTGGSLHRGFSLFF